MSRTDRRAFVLVATVFVMVGGTLSGSTAVAAPRNQGVCEHPVVLVHDMGRSADEWKNLTSSLPERRCSFAFTYGANVVTDAVEVAGLIRIQDSAAQFASFAAKVESETGGQQLDVVAHGAGGLVVDYFLQHLDPARRSGQTASVRRLVTLGPMWAGTDIAGFGSTADVSKRLGIYEPLLALETPFVEPLCGGCRQILLHSELLTDLDRVGIAVPGVQFVNIITMNDLLVSDPMSAALPGMTSIVVQSEDAGNRVDHFGLNDDGAVARLVGAALR